MSTISSVLAGSTQSTFTSPRERLQDELQSQISAGTISSSDSDALSSALDDIDTAMKQNAPSAQGGGQPPSPDDMKAKVNSLIDGEVESGKLTSDQADELKGVFDKAFAGGPGGAGGPQGGDQSSSTSGGIDDVLSNFLKQLQDDASNSSLYTSDGTTDTSGSSSLLSSLVVDYRS